MSVPHTPRTPALLGGVILLSALVSAALTGCAAPASKDAAGIQVVAATSVYGDIARAIGGDAVSVTSLISDAAQDPHSFEASAQAQLALSHADVVIQNGGGYDDFVGTLLKGSDNADATVLDAVALSGLDASADDFNEHVWYDLPAMGHVADELGAVFSRLDPKHTAQFTENVADFDRSIAELQAKSATVKEHHAGEGVAVTEPVPLYLLAACGLVDETPAAFSRAVEEGTGVAPALMHTTLQLLQGERVRLLVYNEQTSGPETEQLIAAAKASGTPAVPVTETLPPGTSYLGWMGDNLDAVTAALERG
jgi:zinc/manganese transport system substrate-binding protein